MIKNKEQYLTETEISDWLGIKLSTLRSRRVEGGFIPFVKVGRLVRYPLSKVENYLNSNLVTSTTEHNKKEAENLCGNFSLPLGSKYPTPTKELNNG